MTFAAASKADETRRAYSREWRSFATWCASNVSVRRDPAGNEKPDKERSTERIDAIVAALMAVGRLQTAQGGSIYEERGLLLI